MTIVDLVDKATTTNEDNLEPYHHGVLDILRSGGKEWYIQGYRYHIWSFALGDYMRSYVRRKL